MMSLYFAFYNFCGVHNTLRVTPAKEAGITDHIWTLRELHNGRLIFQLVVDTFPSDHPPLALIESLEYV
jgi:hypothetical protein